MFGQDAGGCGCGLSQCGAKPRQHEPGEIVRLELIAPRLGGLPEGMTGEMMADFVCQNACRAPVRANAIRHLRHKMWVEQDHAPSVYDLSCSGCGGGCDQVEVHFQPAYANDPFDLCSGFSKICVGYGIGLPDVAQLASAAYVCLARPVVEQACLRPFPAHCAFVFVAKIALSLGWKRTATRN
ncbi:hypothetical protein AQZ52_08595 [Novosphingobium fuchskuhlense]|uniref:Uncharacterized protein n=1 Tax=Novosphingobium fuchskuhlense TaxID=1117702 RepID=A0A124JUW5_9SPHN|nr:hypothetical protein AQZ52_08595 [Novosphingobium fuchskuhlense]